MFEGQVAILRARDSLGCTDFLVLNRKQTIDWALNFEGVVMGVWKTDSFISRRVGIEFEPNTTPLKYYGVTKWLRALINLLQRINRNILFCPAFTMGKEIWIGDHFVSVIWIKWIKINIWWTWTSASLECLLSLTNSRSCSLSSRVLSATPREAYKRVYPTACVHPPPSLFPIFLEGRRRMYTG